MTVFQETSCVVFDSIHFSVVWCVSWQCYIDSFTVPVDMWIAQLERICSGLSICLSYFRAFFLFILLIIHGFEMFNSLYVNIRLDNSSSTNTERVVVLETIFSIRSALATIAFWKPVIGDRRLFYFDKNSFYFLLECPIQNNNKKLLWNLTHLKAGMEGVVAFCYRFNGHNHNQPLSWTRKWVKTIVNTFETSHRSSERVAFLCRLFHVKS